ncbi:unnamed protein product [Rhizophagus irregularis]|uniref:Uncharacterized protein n=1 Tax=Rhizophagus irregularis TaxID=588596 RepID=A0A916EJM2_9GLOM|nr:unnamed protein product [Rhizophagus irregularis]CAB5393606.1 unnamed protein product [Rhizophagus irregularis]
MDPLDNIGLIRWDACLELNFGLGYKGDALPDLDFIKVTPFLDLDFSDALPGSGFWLGLLNDALPGFGFQLGLLKRRPPGFGFHKGDALPGPGFWLGLLKRTPLGPGFWHGL